MSRRICTVFFIGSILFSLVTVHAAAASSPSYSAGVRVGDWWNYGSFEGDCRAACPPGFLAELNITEATAMVVGQGNATSVTIRNTIAFNNQTVRTYTTLGDLSSGIGNLSLVSSTLIAGGLTQGEPISKAIGAPVVNGTAIGLYAGANRTLNILDDTANQRLYRWDQVTGVLMSFNLNQSSAHLYYRLTGTSLWHYNIAIYDGNCQPILPVSCGYTPLQATIIAGTTVAYNNTGTLIHSVYSCTPDNNPPPSPEACSFYNSPSTAPSFASPGILPGKIWNLTFPVPGQFYYYDNSNPNMKGVVTVLGNATNPTDFTIHANPNPVIVPQGLTIAVTLSASATGGYTGPVSFSDVFPTGPDYPTTNGPIDTTGYFYGGSGGFGVIFAVIASFNTPQGVYSATLTGTGNNLTRSITLSIIVVAPAPSFYLTPYGNSSTTIAAGHATSLAITVHSVAGFSGPVSLTSYSYSSGYLSATIDPGNVTLQPNGSANATLTLNGGYPGNFTVTVWANCQNATLNQRIYLNVNVQQPLGLLLYQLFYIGILQPGSNLLLVNSFTNLGNIPDQVLYGTIAIDFGTYSFTIVPIIILQPNQTATYNLTITIPANTKPGNHPVTATLTWEAQLSVFWTRAPPLILQGQLPVVAAPQPIVPGNNPVSTLITMLASLAIATKDYWLWALAIYIPSVTILTSVVMMRERKRRRAT